MRKIDTTLYFITDSTGWDEDEFLRRVELALMGGATIMQLREKNRTTREYMALAEKVHTLAKKYQVPLIIHRPGGRGAGGGRGGCPCGTVRPAGVPGPLPDGRG